MKRLIYLELIKNQFQIHPICAILGARQIGKTTLAHQFSEEYFQQKVAIFDLENPIHLAQLEHPMLALSQYDGYLIIIDEIQRRPDLFPILRVLVDSRTKKYNFLILGSASRELIQQSSETLAGRIGYIELPPFTFFDTSIELLQNNGNIDLQSYSKDAVAIAEQLHHIAHKLLLRGGFPRSYLADSDEHSFLWRMGYISTFLERDLPNFGFNISPKIMHKFWMMLCFYHGQTFNAAEIAKSLMLTNKTVASYLDILAGTFMIRVLQPWFENIRKRQVKTPKIYFRDSGIYNALASIHSMQELSRNPKIGPLWEGFALEEVITCLQISSMDCYFWSTSNEAELDLLVFKNGKRIGFEFKYTDSPKITKSMNIALQDLKLDHLYLIFPGSFNFPLHEKMTACGFEMLHKIQI